MVTTFLFIDTNVLLHYRTVGEIDWPTLAGTTEVVLVLSAITIRELDRHKTHHQQRKFRRRAQELSSYLHAVLLGKKENAPSFRQGVQLDFHADEPLLDFGKFGLDPDIADDRLVATVLEWKQKHSGDDIRIVTADLGLSLKAHSKSIVVLQPLHSDRLAEEPDPEEKKLRILEKEYSELKNALPKLKLSFAGEPLEQDFISITIKKGAEFDEGQAVKDLAKVKERLPYQPIPEKPVQKKPQKRNIFDLAVGPSLDFQEAMQQLQRPNIERYNAALDTFFEKHFEYLKACHKAEMQKRRMGWLRICLANTGTAPAEDIDLHLHFPDGFFLFDGDAHKPGPPDPPSPPRLEEFLAFGAPANLERMAQGMYSTRHTTGPRIPQAPSNISKPTILRTKSYDVRSHVDMAKHGYTYQIGVFVAAFASDKSLKSFTIDYTISAANLPRPKTGNLSVNVEMEE